MNQLAKIYIKDISIDCVLGVGEKERSIKQTILVSVEIVVDVTKSIITDAIDDTVNYSNLSKKIISEVTQSQFYLLEALGSHILTMCLESQRVMMATVRVSKPLRRVTIEMTREKI